MRKIFKKIPFIVLLSLVVLGSCLVAPAFALDDNAKVITVAGKGGVKVSPDIAYISLSIYTKDVVADKAQKNNNVKINQVIANMKALGIAEKDINTSGYRLSENRTYVKNESKLEGYTASCTMTITVRDLTKVGAVIDKAISGGTDRVNSIQFAVEDPSPYYAEALKEAALNAKTKADAIAGALGVKIKTVQSVMEQSTYYAPVSYDSGGLSLETPLAPMSSIDSEMTVQADELSITANISVVFILE